MVRIYGGLGYRITPRLRLYGGISAPLRRRRRYATRGNLAANRGGADLLMYGCIVPLIILGCVALAALVVLL